MSIAIVFFVYALWSSCFALAKIALTASPPIFLTAFRMLLAGGLILGFLLIKDRASFKISFKQYISLGVLGFFSTYLTNICEYWGLQHLSASKTCFIYSLSPFFSVIFSYLHFKEKLTLKKCIGLLIGFLGFLPVLHLQTGNEGFFTLWSTFSLPDLAIVAATLFSVYGWVLLRVLVKTNLSPLLINGFSMLIGGGFALIHSLCVDSWSPTPVASSKMSYFLLGVAGMTLVSNIICYNLYSYMLKRFTATFLSFAGLISPIFASLNSWIILGETPSPIIFTSIAIVSLGLWIIYQEELKQGYIQKKLEQPS